MGLFSNYEKESHEAAYGQGARDAENAGFLDEVFHGLGDVIGSVVPSTSERESYEKGWHSKK